VPAENRREKIGLSLGLAGYGAKSYCPWLASPPHRSFCPSCGKAA